MSTILKWLGMLVLAFLALFLIWYITGGPKRDMEVYPYVRYNEQTIDIQPATDTEFIPGAKEMINVNPEIKAVKEIKENSYNRY